MKPKVRGITREVILIGKYAFKFPSIRSWWLFLEGLQCNMCEVQRTKCSPHFCPIVFSIIGGFLVVMKRCQPVPDNWDEYADFRKDETYEYYYVHNYVENKPCSFGILDGKLVAVDYGS